MQFNRQWISTILEDKRGSRFELDLSDAKTTNVHVPLSQKITRTLDVSEHLKKPISWMRFATTLEGLIAKTKTDSAPQITSLEQIAEVFLQNPARFEMFLSSEEKETNHLPTRAIEVKALLKAGQSESAAKILLEIGENGFGVSAGEKALWLNLSGKVAMQRMDQCQAMEFFKAAFALDQSTDFRVPLVEVMLLNAVDSRDKSILAAVREMLNSAQSDEELEVASEFKAAVESIKDRNSERDFERCIKHILTDRSFESIDWKYLKSDFHKLSSGQKIVLSIVAKIYEHIEQASLVIIDEPETHLHPSLMAAFIHSLREILTKFNSYAIVATHSPVMLQETPSRFVQVLAGTPLRPIVKQLPLESFGEEISTLTEAVFGLSFEESNFYTVLKKLSDDGFSSEEIVTLFGKKLGLTARSFLNDFDN